LTVISAFLLAAPAVANDVVSLALDAYAQEKNLPSENTMSSVPPSTRKAHEFEWSFERHSYLYKETVDGAEFMRTEGSFQGILLSYTFRPLDLDSFTDIIDNLYRLELRYARGEVDYTGSGTWDGLKDYMYEVRAVAGREFNVNPSLQITPYLGLGYRYLNNGLDQIPAQEIDGQQFVSGYNRESTYYYLPIGVDVYQQLAGGWGIGGNLEYDLWIKGEQASHLEDMEDAQGVNAGIDPLYNDQKSGFGLRGSLKIDKSFARVKLGIEPYYRYWKVSDSQPNVVTAGSGMQIVGGGLEPRNTTQEIGVKVGVKF